MRFTVLSLVVLWAFINGLASATSADLPAKEASQKELKENAEFMREVELRLKISAEEKSVVVFGRAIIPLMARYENFTPELVEEIAREKKIELYFIAKPNVPEGFESVGMDKKPRDFYVWIGVNGEKERNEELEKLKITEEQNRKNLKNAGWLREKKPAVTPKKTGKDA